MIHDIDNRYFNAMNVFFAIVLLIPYTGLGIITINFLHNQGMIAADIKDLCDICKITFVKHENSNSTNYKIIYDDMPTTSKTLNISPSTDETDSLSNNTNKSQQNEVANDCIHGIDDTYINSNYLEELISLHGKTTSNDLLAFLYGLVSTVLIGVAIYLFWDVTKVNIDLNKAETEFRKAKSDYEKIHNTYGNNLASISIATGLTESLALLSSFMETRNNLYLNKFQECISHVARQCETVRASNTTDIEKDIRIRQRIGFIMQVYDMAYGDNIGIDKNHRNNMYEYFSKILGVKYVEPE